MSATILAFPRRSPIQALCRATDGSAPFTAAWCAQHLPLIDAAVDLLEAGNAEFKRRCHSMRSNFRAQSASLLPSLARRPRECRTSYIRLLGRLLILRCNFGLVPKDMLQDRASVEYLRAYRPFEIGHIVEYAPNPLRIFFVDR